MDNDRLEDAADDIREETAEETAEPVQEKDDTDLSSLTPEQCRALNPDFDKDTESLILENEMFAYSVVHKEFGSYGYPIKEELLSAARYGLVYAANKYDPHQVKTKFISYAVHWIRFQIHEAIRGLNPIKLNQNFITKRNKVLNAFNKYKKEHDGEEPAPEELSAATGLSAKVCANIMKVNRGDNFKFISFQTAVNPAAVKDGDNLSVENKLMYEYITTSTSGDVMAKIEFEDMMNVFRARVSPEDYGIFVDRHINGMSFSDIAKKYKMNFASSVSYKLKKTEEVWKKLLNE